jgi:hypothetical protein
MNVARLRKAYVPVAAFGRANPALSAYLTSIYGAETFVAAFDLHSANAIRDYFLDLLKKESASRRIDFVPEGELAREVTNRS